MFLKKHIRWSLWRHFLCLLTVIALIGILIIRLGFVSYSMLRLKIRLVKRRRKKIMQILMSILAVFCLCLHKWKLRKKVIRLWRIICNSLYLMAKALIKTICLMLLERILQISYTILKINMSLINIYKKAQISKYQNYLNFYILIRICLLQYSFANFQPWCMAKSK